jgi:hypothetical protein
VKHGYHVLLVAPLALVLLLKVAQPNTNQADPHLLPLLGLSKLLEPQRRSTHYGTSTANLSEPSLVKMSPRMLDGDQTWI